MQSMNTRILGAEITTGGRVFEMKSSRIIVQSEIDSSLRILIECERNIHSNKFSKRNNKQK